MGRATLRAMLLAIVVVLPALLAQAQIRPVPAPVVASAVSENARDVLARVRPSVIQIKGFFGSTSAQRVGSSPGALRIDPARRAGLEMAGDVPAQKVTHLFAFVASNMTTPWGSSCP